MRLVLEVSEAVHDEIKEYAQGHGVTMKHVILSAVKLYIANPQQPTSKASTVNGEKNGFDISLPVHNLSPHLRWTEDDFKTPISAEEHQGECLAFRRLFAEQYDNIPQKLKDKFGYSTQEIQQMYLGETKINSLIRKEIKAL